MSCCVHLNAVLWSRCVAGIDARLVVASQEKQVIKQAEEEPGEKETKRRSRASAPSPNKKAKTVKVVVKGSSASTPCLPC
jgi:hypothetical protein